MEGDLFLNRTTHELTQTVCKYVQGLWSDVQYCSSVFGRSAGDSSPICWLVHLKWFRLLAGRDLSKHLSSAEDLERSDDRVLFATENNSTFLECIPRSPQATITWFVQHDDHKEEVGQFCLSVCLSMEMVPELLLQESGQREWKAADEGTWWSTSWKHTCEFGTWPTCLRDRQVAMAAHLPLAGGSACECGDMTALLGSIAK